MRRRSWDFGARHEGGGRYRTRHRSRWIGAPVLVGLITLIGTGAAKELWDRFTAWLWATAHLTGDTVLASVVIAVVLALVWRAGR